MAIDQDAINTEIDDAISKPAEMTTAEGTVKRVPVKDLLAAAEFAEKRQARTRKPLGGATIVVANMPGAVGPCSE